MRKRWGLSLLTALLILSVLITGGAIAQDEGEHDRTQLPQVEGDYFAASGNCAVCHSKIVDETGVDVSVDRDWRATLMANSSRDPYWRATVRAEVTNLPAAQAVIEDKCATCHMPMARSTVQLNEGEPAKILDDGFLDPANPLHTLALDGVSCTLCHQITRQKLGEPESFSGGYVIDEGLPQGRRPAFGPYQMDPQRAMIMRDASGYVPVMSPHIEESEMCGSCHTLYTPYVNDEGAIIGEFPEQMVYYEWLYSDYAQTHSCQDCHMPLAEGEAQLSPAIPGGEQYPIYQHLFGGGNLYMVRLLDTFAEELEVTATEEQFAKKSGDILKQMQNQTAAIAIDGAVVSDGATLTVDVTLENKVGHKFPASFPSRRAWLHFVVQDPTGRVIFESGAFRSDGYIIGNNNDAAAGMVEPHYQRITSPDQVQIYEGILRDVNGDVTSTLLRAAGYIKDNRILPHGFQHGAPNGDDFAVVGDATRDDNFMASGGDRVVYEVDLGDAVGPFTARVDLYYQSVAYRWAINLGRYLTGDNPPAEVADFLRYYDAVPNTPILVSTAEVTVK